MMPAKEVRSRNRARLSCERCRRVKRQCDRNVPCGRCVQNALECSLGSRRKTPTTSTSNSPRLLTPSTSQPDRSGPLNSTRNGLLSVPIYMSPSNGTENFSRSRRGQDRRDNTSDVWGLIEIPSFIVPVIEIYTEEIDWIWELIQYSRLHRLVRTPDFVTQNRAIWDEVKVFALAIVAVTAQLCPVDLEAILLCLNTDTCKSAISSFGSAASVMEASYSEAIAYVKTLAESEPSASDLTLQQSLWTAEVFAATFILRNYEKNQGAYRKQSEGLAVDMLRLQHARYVCQPCRTCDIGKQYMVCGPVQDASLNPLEHNPLAHNVFWAYFILDRLSNVVAGSKYLFQAKYANICLHDVLGHSHVTKLVESALQQGEPFMQNSNGLTTDQPRQTAYSGAKCRLAAIVAHFIDRLSRVLDLEFNWPKDAEAIVKDLEKGLSNFKSIILPVINDPTDRFCKAKTLTLVLCMELLQASVTSQIHALFAATLYRPSSTGTPISSEARESIGRQMERRTLDSAKTLIASVLPYTQAALRLRSSWPFFATSVHQQVDQILEVLQKKSKSELVERYVAAEEYQGALLLDYVRYAIKGRNLLALFAQNNNLVVVKFYIDNVCQKLDSFFGTLEIDYDKEALSDRTRIIDEYAPIGALKSRLEFLSNIASEDTNRGADILPVLSDSTITFDELPTSELAWDAIMNDMLELERLFPIPNPIDGLLAL